MPIDTAYRLRGLKFFKFENGSKEPTILRLVQYDEVKKTYKMLNSKNEVVYMDQKEIDENWVKLNPDGIISLINCIAIDNQNEEVPDVMITLHRKGNDGTISAKPYAVCRQAVIDIFILLQQGNYVAGMTITEDTCPPEVRFDGCYNFKKATNWEEIAVYMDDTLDSILSVTNTKKYDKRLQLIKSRDKMGIHGYCETLRELLHNNYFMLDFHKAFGIDEFEFPYFDFEDYNTNKILTEYIIRNKYEVPTRFYPVHYDKSIDLSEIQRNHILICPDSFKYPDGQIILLGYDVSETVSFKDYINKGNNPKEALKKTMNDLGWK